MLRLLLGLLLVQFYYGLYLFLLLLFSGAFAHLRLEVLALVLADDLYVFFLPFCDEQFGSFFDILPILLLTGIHFSELQILPH